MSVNIHDSGYKKLFSNHTIFRQLLETFVYEEWVKELDFSSCETLDKSFVSDHYKETESDLIYKVKLRGRTVYIYVLIEFQATVQRFMVVRILSYIASFYLDYIASHQGIKRLPAVFPIVLYNGERRWSAPVRLEDVIEDQPALGEYASRFRYLLLDENAYSQEALLKVRNIVSTLFLAEAHYDIELLQEELLNLFERESDKEAASLFLNWFHQLATTGKISPEDYITLEYVYRDKEEVRTMLMKTLAEERQSIYLQGKAEGKAEGQLLAQRETILYLAEWRFNLSHAQHAALERDLAAIDDLQVVKALLDVLLLIPTLDIFMTQVASARLSGID